MQVLCRYIVLAHVRAAVAQSAGTLLGNWGVAGSRRLWTSLCGGGLVTGEVPVHLLGTAETPKLLRALHKGQPLHSGISPPSCVCISIMYMCVYM